MNNITIIEGKKYEAKDIPDFGMSFVPVKEDHFKKIWNGKLFKGANAYNKDVYYMVVYHDGSWWINCSSDTEGGEIRRLNMKEFNTKEKLLAYMNSEESCICGFIEEVK